VLNWQRGSGSVAHYLRGLGLSTRNNTVAYGYSLTATGSYGVISDQKGSRIGDVFLFAVGAALAFALVNTLVTEGYRKRFPDEPGVVVAFGTSLSLLSVTAAVGTAALAGWLLRAWVAWLAGSFAFTLVYLALVGVEIAVAAALHSGEEEGDVR
jgi:MFS family permease